MKLAKLTAREILDSRGYPTIEVDVVLDDGAVGRAAVPSGKSTGSKEALELRDKDSPRFSGKGVLSAVSYVHHEIFTAIKDTNLSEQSIVDGKLVEIDGTPDKSRLGANAILGVSMAIARAVANSQQIPLSSYLAMQFGYTPEYLPIPMMNVINGGAHADSGIDVQEFMIVPIHADSMRTAVRMAAEVYHSLSAVLVNAGQRISVGDEGGFAPRLANTEEVIKTLIEAIAHAGYKPGKDVAIALDPAANSFYKNGIYQFEGVKRSAQEMIQYYMEMASRYPIVSIEDGLAEDDWQGWAEFTKVANSTGLQLVGDDIFVTNAAIFDRGVKEEVANAILIKPNQIGTITETITTMQHAKIAGYKTVISHRSGETTDTFISDLALATNAGQMKSGAPARGERVAKYNQLMRLQDEFPNTKMTSGIYRL